MPGRTPYEAVETFLVPIRAALACIARGKITTSRGGLSPRVGETYQWSINNGGGNGPLRISTRGYGYSLVLDDSELWALQWQPDGPSPEKMPHLHLGPSLVAASAPITPKGHLRTGRMTFETAVRWCIDFGAVPLHADWDNRLTLAEAPHLLYRTWSHEPPGASPVAQ